MHYPKPAYRCFLLIPLLAVISACHTRKVSVSPAPHAEGKTYSKPSARPSNSAYNEDVQAYIKLYSPFAVAEMKKYGVPASIIIAQGIHESRAGKSVLATVANNHFGIKCTGDWNGDSFHMDDDRPSECFRKYNNPESSFNDHMLFLQRKRYASLFLLQSSDYKGWAYGLKRCGYATNPRYAEILVSMIERYQLDRFDMGSFDAPAVAVAKSEPAREAAARKLPAPVASSTAAGSPALKTAMSKPLEKAGSDTPPSSSTEVREGNSAQAIVSPGTGSKTFVVTDTVHRKVYVTDTVYQYAYQKALNQVAAPDTRHKPAAAQVTSAPDTAAVKPQATAQPAPENSKAQSSTVREYKVVQGDTLYGICRKNKLNIEEVRQLNQLPDYSIKIDQVLKLPQPEN